MDSEQFSSTFYQRNDPVINKGTKSGLGTSSSVISCRPIHCGIYQNNRSQKYNMDCVIILICFWLRPNASQWLYIDIAFQTLQQEGDLSWLIHCLWAHWNPPLLKQSKRNMSKGGSILQIFLWSQISLSARACHSGWIGPGLLLSWLCIQWVPVLPILWLCGNGQVSLTYA